MKVFEFYTGTKTYMYPNGELATPERIQMDFPAITTFRHVIETDELGQVCFAVQNFAAMRTMYDIDPSLDDASALQVLTTVINSEGEQQGISNETRIADALEDLVVLSMPDEEV